MIDKERQEIIRRFRRNTYSLVIRILIIFGSAGFLGLIIGKKIDSMFGIEPSGSVATLVASYVISWIIVIKLRATFIKKTNPLEKKIRES